MNTARENDSGHFLIIAGTPKAGTTSLYVYLRDHPEVCACRIKEPRYFMPADDAVTVKLCYGREPLSQYLNLFECPDPEALRVEASPEYFYTPGTAERIRAVLPNARIVVVLRDPISRLASWYRFARFMKVVEADFGFDQFIELQRRDTRPVNQREAWLRGLETGCYAGDLERHFRVFGRDRVQPIWFNELEDNPRAVMENLSRFCGIDPVFYASYPFRPVNKTIEVRKPGVLTAYTGLRRLVSRALKPSRDTRRALRRLRARLEPWILWFSTSPMPQVSPSEQTLQFLRDYYRGDAEDLAKLLGQPVPWAYTLRPGDHL